MTIIFIIIILLIVLYNRRNKETGCVKKAACTCNINKTINTERKMLNDTFNISVTMQDPAVDSFAYLRSFETPESLFDKSLTVANIEGPFMSGIVAPLDSFEKGYEYMIGV